MEWQLRYLIAYGILMLLLTNIQHGYLIMMFSWVCVCAELYSFTCPPVTSYN